MTYNYYKTNLQQNNKQICATNPRMAHLTPQGAIINNVLQTYIAFFKKEGGRSFKGFANHDNYRSGVPSKEEFIKVVREGRYRGYHLHFEEIKDGMWITVSRWGSPDKMNKSRSD